MVILGSGAVGVEFASIFNRFGTRSRSSNCCRASCPSRTKAISAELARSLQEAGYHGAHRQRRSRRRARSATAWSVEVRAGRRRSERLDARGLPAGGDRTRARDDGAGCRRRRPRARARLRRVDELYRTNVPGISAIGDVITLGTPGHPQLAHVSSAEGILAAERIAGEEVRPINYDHVPGCTYCDPEIGSVGLTEREAGERGYDVRVGTFPFGVLARAKIGERDRGLREDRRREEIRRGARRAHHRPASHRARRRGHARAAARVHGRRAHSHDPRAPDDVGGRRRRRRTRRTARRYICEVQAAGPRLQATRRRLTRDFSPEPRQARKPWSPVAARGLRCADPCSAARAVLLHPPHAGHRGAAGAFCIARSRWWAGSIAVSVRKGSRWRRRTRLDRGTPSRRSSAISGRSITRGVRPRDIFAQYMARGASPTRGRDLNLHFSHMPRAGRGRADDHRANQHAGRSDSRHGGCRAGRASAGRPIVAMTYIGDGGTSTGAFHEGLNFAAVQKLPFVRRLPKTTSTPTRRRSASRWPSTHRSARGSVRHSPRDGRRQRRARGVRRGEACRRSRARAARVRRSSAWTPCG